MPARNAKTAPTMVFWKAAGLAKPSKNRPLQDLKTTDRTFLTTKKYISPHLNFMDEYLTKEWRVAFTLEEGNLKVIRL